MRRKSQVAKSLCYIDQIPFDMCDSVANTIDVDGDGNCGFRAIGVGLGHGSNTWANIRVTIWREIFNNKSRYALMEKGRVEKVFNRIGWYNGSCKPDYWFDASDMGFAVANAFNVALVSLSVDLSVVYFPLSKPIPTNPQIICIAHVNGNHYINMTLKDNCQLPPLAHTRKTLHEIDAGGWLDYVLERLAYIPEASEIYLDDE